MADWLQNYGSALRARLRDPVLLAIAMISLVIAFVNMETSISDAARLGKTLSPLREAIGEFSSVAVIILLLAPVFAFFDAFPMTRRNWPRRALGYFAASFVFSALHVTLMVLIRTALWPALVGGTYEFFDSDYDAAIYEYRKDAVTFVLYMIIAALQRQIQQARAAATGAAEPITLKSGATTILLQPAEFLFAKSAGNYAEITSLSGTQLARVTLAELEGLLREKDCKAVRIHRSTLVNRAAVMETAPIAGGDLTVKLRGGEVLRASRRYKTALES